MPRTMPAVPNRARLSTQSRPVGVDRESKIVRGYVVAQEGPFKSEGRGEFDEIALSRIVELWPSGGLKSRFAHPNESNDGLGRYLGRAHKPYLSTTQTERGGKVVEVRCVRADLHLDKSAFTSPEGDLGNYILDLAESDPQALSSSLVLSRDEEYRLEKDGSRTRNLDGEPLPPLWRPKRLYASDVVDEGDAVDGFLSPTGELKYTRDFLSTGEAMLNKLFHGQTRETVQARLSAYIHRYLDGRYGTVNTHNLGASLGGVLDSYINAAVSDERPREVILAQMGEASGLPVEQVSAIVQGEEVDVPLDALVAFAKVLACPLGELVTAAEEDGMIFAGSEEPASEEAPADAPAEDAPAPPADAPAPMSANPSILKRKLALKEKAGY